MAAIRRALGRVAAAGLREFVSALAAAAGQNLGNRLAPPPEKKSSGDDKEK